MPSQTEKLQRKGKLEIARGILDVQLAEAEALYSASETWHTKLRGGSISPLTRTHRELVVELAFLYAFRAWESFLEETFVLYLIGNTIPKRKAPKRFVLPPSKSHAFEFVKEGKKYSDWTTAEEVVKRADRFFRCGEPYSTALKPRQNLLQDLKTLRNAIAHSSAWCRERYQGLVRRELSTFQRSCGVGRFLTTLRPNVVPPESFFESYLSNLALIANVIVPKRP